MFNIGGGEMILLAVIALLVFGPEGLPDIAKTVARTVRALKAAANDFQTEVSTALTVENQRLDIEKRRRKHPSTPTFEAAEQEETATALLVDSKDAVQAQVLVAEGETPLVPSVAVVEADSSAQDQSAAAEEAATTTSAAGVAFPTGEASAPGVGAPANSANSAISEGYLDALDSAVATKPAPLVDDFDEDGPAVPMRKVPRTPLAEMTVAKTTVAETTNPETKVEEAPAAAAARETLA